MKSFITILLSLAFNLKASGQSAFWLGPILGANYTSLINSEDKGVGPMYKSKFSLSPGVGLSLGYLLKDKFYINLSPQFTTLSHNVTGASDTGAITGLDGSIKFKTLIVPLKLGMDFNTWRSGKISFNIGCFYSKFLALSERVEYYNNIIDPTKEKYILRTTENEVQEYTFPDGYKYTSRGDDWIYKRSALGVSAGIELKHYISDKLSININFPIMYTLGDVENKKEINYTYSTNAPQPAPSEYTRNFWYDGSYARYYDRPQAKYGQRPNTAMLISGLGVGINYHFRRTIKLK